MGNKTLRALAVTLGLGICATVQAQSPYSAPAQWNNFYPSSGNGSTLTSAQDVSPLPSPVPDAVASEGPTGSGVVNAGDLVGGDCQSCQKSEYASAVAAPWGGSGRLPLKPWFGSTNVLLFTMAGNSGRWVASGLGGYTTGVADPNFAAGFDVTAGRYFGNGRFGLGITYMLWNPSSESVIRTGTPGTIRAAIPAYRDVSINIGGVDTVYDYIDGTSANTAGAAAVRVSRDLQFQGLEVNLSGFGSMGARRVSRNCCPKGVFGRNLGLCKDCYGYGGITGPFVRPCGGRLRIVNSHGFRWFQTKDSLELAYNIDAAPGYQANDLYDNYDVQNDLFGYQFGSRLSYCLTSRLNLNIGGKFGLYGNRAELRHRLGSQNTLAYRNGVSSDVINTTSTDTTLASMGELDLGLGYRVSCAWTIRGGYRMLGLTGVATGVNAITDSYATVASSGKVYANDSYILHGGYVGLEFNW